MQYLAKFKQAHSLLLIIVIFSLHSCLKEEENIFGKSSAERLIDAAKEYEEILSSAENGWAMDYFAEYEENKLGGFQILCHFDKGKVTMAGTFTVANKYRNVGEKIASSYSFIDSQGPVLSFDGYNPILHSFADATQIDRDGQAGDFEFIIIKATKDEVVMRGIKRNLKIVMRPMEAAKDWKEYCDEVVQMQKNLSEITRFAVNKEGKRIGFLSFWANDNEVHNTEGIQIEKTKYTVNNKGLNLYDSLSIDNTVLKYLTWDQENASFIDSSEKSNININPVYIKTENLPGTYVVTSDNRNDPVTVSMTLSADGKKLRVSKEFLGDHEFDIEIDGSNRLSIKSQVLKIDKDKNLYTKLCVASITNIIIFDLDLNYGNSYPYNGSWYRGTEEKPELRFMKSTFSLSLFTTYTVGLRVIVYNGGTVIKMTIL